MSARNVLTDMRFLCIKKKPLELQCNTINKEA